ncbi:MAG TPA: hypothetical protein VIO14_00530 [Dehalococcoidia bacterium]
MEERTREVRRVTVTLDLTLTEEDWAWLREALPDGPIALDERRSEAFAQVLIGFIETARR